MTETPQFSAKATEKVAKSIQKGKKVSQQQAFGAMMETRQVANMLMGTVGRLTQAQSALEEALIRINTNLSILVRALQDKGVLTEAEHQEAWDKYVVKPQDEALTKHIEQLKTQSAEDAYFADLLERTRKHTFADRTVPAGPDGQTENVTGAEVKDYFVQSLVNPRGRRNVVEELRKEMPDLPTFTPPPPEPEPEPEKAKHPDCNYCGSPDCPFCSQVAVTGL